jgi:hypothetical protein
MIFDVLEGLLWLVDFPRWVAQTRTGKVAAVAVLLGLLLWLGFGLSGWFFGAPFLAAAIPFLIWEHRTTKAVQRAGASRSSSA